MAIVVSGARDLKYWVLGPSGLTVCTTAVLVSWSNMTATGAQATVGSWEFGKTACEELRRESPYTDHSCVGTMHEPAY